MISASHNPFYDNGIKLLNGNGQKIEAEIEERIEAYIDGEIEELPLARKEDIGRTVDFCFRTKPLYRISDLHSKP